MSSETFKIRIIDSRQKTKGVVKWIQTSGALALLSGILFGPGILVDSAAMQWAGFCLFLLLCTFAANAWNDMPMTIDEARKKLDELEKRSAS